MPVNVLVLDIGNFPEPQVEVQKERGINFYTEEESKRIPSKDIHVILVDSPRQKPSDSFIPQLLEYSVERKGIWINYSFASWNDYRNLHGFYFYTFPLQMQTNFWDFINNAHLSFIDSDYFGFELLHSVRATTLDGKNFEAKKAYIHREYVKPSIYVTGESPFNLPQRFELTIDDGRSKNRGRFILGRIETTNFNAKVVLKRKAELRQSFPEISPETVREFKIDDFEGKNLTEKSLKEIFAALPSYTEENVGVLNDSIDSRATFGIVRGSPAGLVYGSVDYDLNSTEQRNVEYVTQTIATLGRRTGGYPEQNRKKLHEVTELPKETKIENQTLSKENIPFDVYS